MLCCGSSNQTFVFPNEATCAALSASQKSALQGLAKEGGVEIRFFSESGYAKAREKTFVGGDHEHFPFAIALPKTAYEVSLVLKCCAASGIRDMSVYSGGHSTQGMKGSVVIKMTAINHVTVTDGASPVVTFGGGCTNAQVDAACKPYGVAITAGNAGSVGAVGAMLGGGVGFLARWQGLTIDNLIEATVVLADGTIVVANKDGEHSDLLFALKGGGGNFGVVVEAKVKAGRLDFYPNKKGDLYYEERIVRHGSTGLFGNRMGSAEAVFGAWRDYALKAPNHVSCDCILPAGGPMVQIFTYKGEHEDALAESKNSWKSLGKAALTMGKPKNYFDGPQADLDKRLAADFPMPHAWRLAIMDSLPDEAVKILMHAVNEGRPNNQSLIHVERLGGKIDDPEDGEDASAFAHRGGKFWISMIGTYSVRGKKRTPEQDAKVDAWLEALYTDLQPYAVGDNCTGTMAYCDEKTGKINKVNAFGEKGYHNQEKAKLRIARLVAAKKKYDPTNLFQYVENGFSNAVNIDPEWKC